MPTSVKEACVQVLGRDTSSGDQDVLTYVQGILGDDEFDFGPGAQDAYDAFGDFLIEGGFVADEDASLAACRKFKALLRGEEAEAAAAQPTAKDDAFTALTGGPVALEDVDDTPLLYRSDRSAVKNMIQTPMGDKEDGSYKLTEAEALKAVKRAEREERLRMLAFQQHEANMKAHLQGMKARVVRNQGGAAIRDIHLEGFSISNGGEELISDASITFAFGRRYGLIGRNGTGKTTFLRALSSHSIKGLPPHCQVLHVEQEVAADDTPALEVVLRCDTERHDLLQEEATLQAALQQGEAGGGSSDADTDAQQTRLAAVFKRLEEIDADGARSRAAEILSGLSFTNEMMAAGTKTFSGGWRMRISLAQALFAEPDFLLLDEPTNHLDLHAVIWLENYLLKWPKTVLVVSHAREFLNSVCTNVIHLTSKKLIMYSGNYATFEKTAAERKKNAAKLAESQEKERAHIQDFIDKFRFNAKRASLVQSRIKALERMAVSEAPEAEAEYVFNFPEPGTEGLTTNVCGFNDVDFNYPGGPKLFKNLNFGLDMASRLAIVGDNGIGKSTLLNLISGVLEPTTGHIDRDQRVRWAQFNQHHVDGLDLTLNAVQYMCKEYPSVKPQEHRSYLGQFGMGGDLALQPMYTLSGGQKSRVAFAKVCYTKPAMLLLDEPSNHLDMEAVDALIAGLNQFKGGVLMVSHDQYLIESCVDDLWVCSGGTIRPYAGTFDSYKASLRK